MTDRRFLRVLAGERLDPPPIWLMRQAGRYLPEYRHTRAQANGFLDLCYTPALAREVTLQPIRRYAFDAAILFSDILVLPHALGQAVWFVEGEGPRLEPIRDEAGLLALKPGESGGSLAPVLETVADLRATLPHEVALIGFAGAPWTVACYMVAGGGSKDFVAVRTLAASEPDFFRALIDLLVEETIGYLAAQVEAGADALQLFDSWAGSLAEDGFDDWVIRPTRRIVEGLRTRGVDVPIIGFPRGGAALLERFIVETGVDAVSGDVACPLSALAAVQPRVAVQGNLDPAVVVAGGTRLDAAVDRIVGGLRDGPHVFNLGHGVVPQTPPDHVARLVDRVRNTSA